MAKIAVRYIGEHAVRLQEHQGTFYDGNGTPLPNNILNPGDTLMMNEEEVLGQTYYEDQRGSGQLRSLGSGRIVLPEHKDVPESELVDHGYRFHQGRPDFEPLKTTATKKRGKKESTEGAALSEEAPIDESADMLLDADTAQKG